MHPACSLRTAGRDLEAQEQRSAAGSPAVAERRPAGAKRRTLRAGIFPAGSPGPDVSAVRHDPPMASLDELPPYRRAQLLWRWAHQGVAFVEAWSAMPTNGPVVCRLPRREGRARASRCPAMTVGTTSNEQAGCCAGKQESAVWEPPSALRVDRAGAGFAGVEGWPPGRCRHSGVGLPRGRVAGTGGRPGRGSGYCRPALPLPGRRV
jgi:hypothetical protein